MTGITNKRLVYFGIALLFAAIAFAAYWQQIYFLFVPTALVAFFLLLQYPKYVFYLLILTIPWSVEFQYDSLNTDLPDEPLMLICSLSALFYLTYYKTKSTFRLHPLFFIILLQFLWTLITVFTSTDVLVSSKYLLAKGWYLGSFLFLPIFLLKEEKVLKKAAVLLMCSMLLVTVISFVRHGMNNWTFEKVNNSVKPFFRNHVNYSSLLVFMVPLQIAIMRLTSEKIRKVLIAILVFTVMALYFSYSRGAWLALIVGLIVYWMLRKKLLVFGFFFCLIIVVASVFWLQSNDRFEKLYNDYKSTIFHSDFRQHLVATYQLKDLSNAERLYRWIAGVRMVKDSWQTGFGPSTFYNQYKSYTLPAFKTYVSDNPERSTVHNYFLLMLIEQGALGCVLFIVLIAAMFGYAQKIYFQTNDRFWKTVSSAAASILAMQCVINFLSDMIETDKVGSVFYLCISVLIIADVKTRKQESNFTADVQGIS